MKKTLSQVLFAFPGFVTKGKVKRKLPSKVTLKSVVEFISNGRVGVYSKLSDCERDFLKSLLNRIRYAYGDKVKVLPNGTLVFDNVLINDWADKTKLNVKGFGTGQINVSQSAIRDGINRLLTYIEETGETKIPFSKISLITMGVNIAKLKGKDDRVYNENPFQTFPYLFSSLGLNARIEEKDEKAIDKIINSRYERYSRDWSPFSTTYLVVDYDDVEEIKKAKEILKNKRISGGCFLMDKVKPTLSGRKVSVRITKRESDRIDRLVEEYVKDPMKVRKLLIDNYVLERTVELSNKIISEKDEKIELLEKETKRLEDGLVAITG